MLKRVLISICASLFFASLAPAGQTFLIGSPAIVNGTSNTPSINAGTASLPRGNFIFQNGGLASTNALLVNVQVSIDNTNFVTIGTYIPTVTNAVSDSYTPGYTNQTIYVRAQIITTNSVSISGNYGN